MLQWTTPISNRYKSLAGSRAHAHIPSGWKGADENLRSTLLLICLRFDFDEWSARKVFVICCLQWQRKSFPSKNGAMKIGNYLRQSNGSCVEEVRAFSMILDEMMQLLLCDPAERWTNALKANWLELIGLARVCAIRFRLIRQITQLNYQLLSIAIAAWWAPAVVLFHFPYRLKLHNSASNVTSTIKLENNKSFRQFMGIFNNTPHFYRNSVKLNK